MENQLQPLLAKVEFATHHVQVPWNEDAVIYGPEWKTEEEERRTAPRKPMEEWTGIPKSQLPPDEELTDEQVTALFEALEKMLSAYNASPLFQFDVPDRVKYRAIRANFDREMPFLQWHDHYFEFCTPGQEHFTCALGDYCECGRMANFLLTFRNDDALPKDVAPEDEWLGDYLRQKEEREKMDWG